MLSLKLKSFPFSIFILTGHAVAEAHSLSIFYLTKSYCRWSSSHSLYAGFNIKKFTTLYLRSQIYVYCTKVKTLDVINFK
jgi:hypothetical protein